MISAVDTVFTLLIVSDLILVGAGRLRFQIKLVAVQGLLLGLLPLTVEISPSAVIVALSALVIKGLVFPWLMLRAIRHTQTWHEDKPLIGPLLATFAGIVNLGAAFYLCARLNLPFSGVSRLAAPFAFFTILSGLFMLATRQKALSMVLGYVVLENGIFAFGTAMSAHIPLIVELGVLLDLFVAVFVMGIATHQISNEFDHSDVSRLDELKG
ncbi:MAG: Hydrogenase-4 component E [Deltaproteobacteria bacterium ADurb.Bin510]|nr:MAG: Hydrogenase-4 component E [Deltaproteobacteria bacterium ADurb.Bin510]